MSCSVISKISNVTRSVHMAKYSMSEGIYHFRRGVKLTDEISVHTLPHFTHPNATSGPQIPTPKRGTTKGEERDDQLTDNAQDFRFFLIGRQVVIGHDPLLRPQEILQWLDR
jgi:hypothetical protein